MEIQKILNLKNGEWIDNFSLKKKIQNAYNILHINKKATASDISLYYECKAQQKRIDKIQINGYKIN